MPKFQYTAVNVDGNTLHGVVESPDLKSAKKQLNGLKLQVINLEEISLKTKLRKSQLNKYKFEATNQEGKIVKGTISALDENKATTRLTEEYNLKVNKLSHVNASNKAFQKSSEKHKDPSNKPQNTKRIQALKQLIIPLIEDLKNLMKFIQENLNNQTTQSTQDFLEKYILHLDKIKFSDNLENTQNICVKISHILTQSDIFIENSIKQEEKLSVNLNAKNLENKFKTYDTPPSRRKIMPEGTHDNNSFTNLISLLLQSKSSNQRKLVTTKLFKKIKNIFIRNTQENYKLKKQITESLLEISFWLMLVYSMLFIVGHYLSSKTPVKSFPVVLSIYQTYFLIYIITGSILLHTCLKLNNKLFRNTLHKTIFSTSFIIIFLLICINL